MSDWLTHILNGVDTFYKNGCPGQIVVFGPSAQAVVVGDDKHDVVLAVAEYGKGRIAVFSHDSYAFEINNRNRDFPNSNLYRNLRKWLTFDKKPDEDLNILDIELAKYKNFNDLASLQEYDIVISHCMEEYIPRELIEEYLNNGGAFIHATTPWGLLQLNPDKSLLDIGYLKILHAACVTLLDGIAEHSGEHFSTLDKTVKDSCCTFSEKFPDHAGVVNFIENVHLLTKIKKCNGFNECEHDALVCKMWEDVNRSLDKMSQSDGIKSGNILEKFILETWSNIVSIKSKCCKAPGIKCFPGDFDDLPPLTDKSVHFESDKEEVYVTSCYVPAGNIVTVKVSSIQNEWKILVGAHTDNLDAVKVQRWPTICKETELCEIGPFTISSPFGGCLYLISSEDGKGSIDATIEGIVLCPEFNTSSMESIENWKNRNAYMGLWANLLGKHVIFTFPRGSILNLNDPTKILTLYDQLIEHYHDLRGSDVSGYRKIWIVADRQPCAGYMHAGYPIVTHLDVADQTSENFLLNDESFKKGLFWGIFHEIGHNMQLPEWTFEGVEEVTCNVFTLYGMEKLCEIKPWVHPWLRDYLSRTVKFLENGAPFAQWKEDPGIALFIYAQLVEYFGWYVYKDVFRQYKYVSDLKTEQDKIDKWFELFSVCSGFNLRPLTDFWNIPISEAAKNKMDQLPCFKLPTNDTLLNMVPERVKNVEIKYSNLPDEINEG